eukprot:gene12773-12870_t
MSATDIEKLISSVPHWHHIFEIAPGVFTPGSYDPGFLFEKMQLPEDMSGMRVLDVGVSDGYFSLQMARRGADVTAIDYRAKTDHGYHVMEALNPCQIDYHVMNVYDLSRETMGSFDIVVFLGVLYHLPDMMRALNAIRQCCTGTIYVESHSENAFCPDIAAARYYRDATLSGDHTNFWAPNRLCVLDMLHDTGFDVVRDEVWGERIFVEAKAVELKGLRADKMRLGYGVFGG